MITYQNIDSLLFLLAIIAGTIIYLIICKILTDQNDDEDVSFFRPSIGIILSFITLIKTTESESKRRRYILLLISLILILILSVVFIFRGALAWFK
jgi:hypothetical protein